MNYRINEKKEFLKISQNSHENTCVKEHVFEKHLRTTAKGQITLAFKAFKVTGKNK